MNITFGMNSTINQLKINVHIQGRKYFNSTQKLILEQYHKESNNNNLADFIKQKKYTEQVKNTSNLLE